MVRRSFSFFLAFLLIISLQISCLNKTFLKVRAENNLNQTFNYADENGVFLLSMQKGASVRIGKDPNDNGIRFTAEISKENKTALDEKYGAENVTYGMLIAKLTDIQKKGEFNGERVFSENAVYNWAKNGQYTPEINKTRITNLTTKSEYLAKDGDKYLIRGSISGILDKNLTVERVARAYVKCSTANGDEYYFSDFNLENARSVVYVADKAVTNDDDPVGEKYRDWLFENYIMKAVNQKRANFENIECTKNDYQEAEKAYEELILLANSLSERNYSACFSQSDTATLNAKIDALYSAKADEQRLSKRVKNETIIAPTPNNKALEFCKENDIEYVINDGFYIKDQSSTILTSDKNLWEIHCKSYSNGNLTLNFPPVKFSEYDKVCFEINLTNMDCATIFGGRIDIGKKVNIEIVNDISKLACYADGIKISESSDGDLIFNEKPLTIEFKGCSDNGYAELGTIYGEKYDYDTVSVTKKFDTYGGTVVVDGETVNEVSGVYTVPGSDIFSAEDTLYISDFVSDGASDARLFMPTNDFTINRDVSFKITPSNVACAQIGEVSLLPGATYNITLKYISGNVIAVYVDNNPCATIRDYEIINGEKPIVFELGNCNSSSLVTLGAITYTKYKSESLADSVNFNSDKAQVMALNGKMTSFKQGFYATGCKNMAQINHNYVGNGLCLEFEKTADNCAEIILPAVDYTTNNKVTFKIATTKEVGLLSVEGRAIGFDGINGTITITYSDGKLRVLFYDENSNQTTQIDINDKSVINGMAGLTLNLSSLAENSKVYIGNLNISGIKTYAKLRIPSEN